MSKRFMPYVLVQQNNVCIIERMGRYTKTLTAGFKFKMPILDVVTYAHSLKE
jgi:regulator of protease activity HflC (stomatin/prohibitin superfamily)